MLGRGVLLSLWSRFRARGVQRSWETSSVTCVSSAHLIASSIPLAFLLRHKVGHNLHLYLGLSQLIRSGKDVSLTLNQSVPKFKVLLGVMKCHTLRHTFLIYSNSKDRSTTLILFPLHGGLEECKQVSLSLFFLRFIYLFERRESTRVGGGTGGDNPQAYSPWSVEPHRGLSPTNHEVMAWAKTRSHMLKWLSQPGAPQAPLSIFKLWYIVLALYKWK